MAAQTLLQRSLSEAGASTYLTRLGFAVDSADAGEAGARLCNADASANRAGMVHGGAIATVMLGAAELAAASTERARPAPQLRISTLSVSFVGGVRAGTELRAFARVLRRGRDVIHVIADAQDADGSSAAQALLVYGVVNGDVPASGVVRSRAALESHALREPLAGSPFMDGAEALLLEGGAEWSCMMIPFEPNEAVGRRVHDGAVVGLVDTCVAMAAFKSCREHAGGPSATLSISLAWACTNVGETRAGARVIGRKGSLFTTEAEVWDDSGAMCASGLACYRIAGAAV